MPTNSLGQGTVNVPINLLDSEKAILGRLALEDDRSLGDFLRRIIITGLRVNNPRAARELEDIRMAHNVRQTTARELLGTKAKIIKGGKK